VQLTEHEARAIGALVELLSPEHSREKHGAVEVILERDDRTLKVTVSNWIGTFVLSNGRLIAMERRPKT
jgi:hypothetical protein